jgi:hypothetical protein
VKTIGPAAPPAAPSVVRLAALSALAALATIALSAGPARAAADRGPADEVQPPPQTTGSTPGSMSAPGPAPVSQPAAPFSLPGPVTDHDAVIGHWGIEARRIAAAPYPLALLPSGCTTIAAPPAPPCTIDMGAIALRHWTTRNLAWNVGLAFALGGGRQGSMALDTYYGIGPIGGLTLLLANWRHLAVGASPEASLVYFKPSGGAGSGTKLFAFRAQLEGELHFGFVDVPALSVGITTGLVFQYESAPGAATWAVSVDDARSVWGTLSSLFIRYYL